MKTGYYQPREERYQLDERIIIQTLAEIESWYEGQAGSPHVWLELNEIQ
jgi:hypothetical protein